MGFRRVLIANNGMAASKFLTSMSLSKELLHGETRTLYFGMVSPDDFEANSTYIQLLDFVVQVPSGPSKRNYGNVDLIVSLAKKYECDAVWPGWGHASENYELAKELEHAGIAWIGPTWESMLQLGDKVESLLQAQRVGVPCAPWSGEGATTAEQSGLYDETQVLCECDRIGYPVMLKASSGGGGRGIRRVDRREDCVEAYLQIKAEVSEGVIFAMKCVDNCRHVEVQIVGDGKGRCIALSGRDCSVQRRHQKLVEEGPPPFISQNILEEMESAAERLCSSVNYKNAGTVEFLFKPETDEFYFLEVNCRLQVEHPVTELLWNLNLPFIQVAIAEGDRSLEEIPGLDRYLSDSRQKSRPDRHVVACRIVAEDPSNKWQPSSGEIFEIRQPLVPSSNCCFAYFSVCSSGSRIHQFADSQFGHVFMVGKDRESAILLLHRYLSELSVVGSVSTNIDFMARNIIEPKNSQFAIAGPPNTNWLDRMMVLHENNACKTSPLTSLAACCHLAMNSFSSADQELLRWVRKGHRAPHTPASYSETLLCPGGEKVRFETIRIGINSIRVSLASGNNRYIDVDWIAGGSSSRAIMTIHGSSSVFVSLVAVSATKLKVQVGKDAPWDHFEVEANDSSKIVAPMNGRLVRWLVPDLSLVESGQRVCEVEAMKMISVVAAKCSGVLQYKVQEGVSFIEGDVLADIEEKLDAGKISVPEICSGEIFSSWPLFFSSGGNLDFEKPLVVDRLMSGFVDGVDIEKLESLDFTCDEIREIVNRFITDEVWDVRCTESVGSETEYLTLVSSCSDKDLLASWRRRTSLGLRMQFVLSLLEYAELSEDMTGIVSALDARLHRPLLKVLGMKRDAKMSKGKPRKELSTSFSDPEIKLAKRRAKAGEAGSFFIYDLPEMLTRAVGKLWMSKKRAEGVIISVQQLTLGDDEELREQPVNGALMMDLCGMAAFLVHMRTPECPSGRRVIFIGNDITFQIGTFSVEEDKLYLRASQLARSLGIPRIYIACNSGARLGLCTEVQSLFRVEWNDPKNLSQGFQYLYLTDADYATVCRGKAVAPVIAREYCHAEHGKIWILSDVIGNENEFIGVENLVWSGAIAGESSKAYKEIFTLSYVTGRTVGIGAYIARLCQRIIQKTDSPILLTGFQALNKLIGAEVYQSNEEIGGVGVMFRNGVSHLTVKDDAEGIDAILHWLQFVPESVGKPLPVYQAVHDPVNRTLADPRDGGRSLVFEEKSSGSETIFDKGSFVEVQTAWARSVIAGRARLGGIPLGVIVVETRQTHYFQPADPADPLSQSVARPQAGQVWYPDSAYKTAQAISDFNREGLPLMILANWRGFSGGQRDMFNEILKFGAYIVDALQEYMQPVFVYLPPKAELRGGAWVVVDSRINPEKIEMYADPTARGGVLEPSGTTEIKFRTQSLLDLMTRTTSHESIDHFNSVKPMLVQVANTFADMHDTPARMVHTGAIKAVVPWKHAREFFFYRLRFRLGLHALVPPLSLTSTVAERPHSPEFDRLISESRLF